MSRTNKFMFDFSFDPQEEKQPLTEDEQYEEQMEEELEVEPPAPTFSEEELIAAEEESFAQGKAEGLKEAAETQQQMIANAMTSITDTIAMIFETQSASLRNHEDAALKVALAVTRKMLPVMAENGALEEIERIVQQSMEPLQTETRVVIKVHESLVEAISDKAQEIAAVDGYEGRLVVQPDEKIIPGDCKIEWSDGGAERDFNALMTQIDEIIERNLTQAASGGQTQTADNPSA